MLLVIHSIVARENIILGTYRKGAVHKKCDRFLPDKDQFLLVRSFIYWLAGYRIWINISFPGSTFLKLITLPISTKFEIRDIPIVGIILNMDGVSKCTDAHA